MLVALTDFAFAAEPMQPSGLLIAIVWNIQLRALPIWAEITAPSGGREVAVSQYFAFAEAGMNKVNFTCAHDFGLIEGLADGSAWDPYRDKLLEPAK